MNEIQFRELSYLKIFFILFFSRFIKTKNVHRWQKYSKCDIEYFSIKNKNKLKNTKKNINIQSDFYPMN